MSSMHDAPPADSHLDRGRGTLPRNPNGQPALLGVDIRRLESTASEAFEFSAPNLSFEPIPQIDHRIASVSAFDFLEHVPQVLTGAEPNTTVFPFIRLMNEVWGVLASGGWFWRRERQGKLVDFRWELEAVKTLPSGFAR